MEVKYQATQQAFLRNDEGHNIIISEDESIAGLPRTYEELQHLLQRESDKRVTQALKTAFVKWQIRYKCELDSEREKFERRITEVKVKTEEEILQKCEKELDEIRRALRNKELEIKAISMLAGNKLPVEFKDFLLGEDEESTISGIDSFQRIWSKKIDEAVKARIFQERILSLDLKDNLDRGDT